MNRIRVLQISSGFAIEGPSGGLGRFAMELSRKLDPAQVETILCGLWNHGTPLEQERVDRLQAEGVEAFTASAFSESAPYQRFWAAFRAIRTQMAGRHVDVIHSHEQFGDMMALLLRPFLRPKAVIRTVHNEREWSRRPLRRIFLTGLVYPLAFQREIGVSQQVVDNLDSRLLAHLLRRRAVCIYNSLNLERFGRVSRPPEEIRREFFVSSGEVVLCTIGRLVTQKGYELLIEAMRGVVTERPNVKLVLVGDGPLRDTLANQAEMLGLENHILFVGQRSDVENILSISDLFVSSSLWEGLPTVIIESMAACVPVVATDVSGTRELIQDGVTGYLVRPGDSDALCRKITDVMDRFQDTRSVVQYARADVERRFTVDNAADCYINLYRGLTR